jgi:iron complex transport system ATP-binding protein
MTAIQANAISLTYGSNRIIDRLSLQVPGGQITALIGANGCGKSTLLRGLARLMPLHHGQVILDGHDIAHIPATVLAQRLGMLPQSPHAPEGLTVYELVAQGRYPHQSWLQQWRDQDAHAVQQALIMTNLVEFAQRPVDALSGGQRQRAWIAMTLAQDTAMILLDEPTTYLDVAHQIEVLQLLERLNREQGRTVVMVLHDINHATRFAHHLVALKAGQIMAAGPPRQVVTVQLLADVFGVEADILQDPRTLQPICVVYGVHYSTAMS